ncbi:MAG: glutamyl-tRNA reductase [Acidimicrobiia bacterium]|nr:glutamyl-tRNA reductase [Acidimicrobiia bacterium]MYC57683.1 glutamyl-tRNA reductase [Acidimicrobiia bacterium]MYG93587.1 glutamyl-tRNA reductase [Acidimicrobiia bacterium]MYI31195.1 glutamyl-tRNA reductase [Acidimicrobiia bacterium]
MGKAVAVLAIGLNHRSAPLDLLGEMKVDDSDLAKALANLISREHISEVVLLSTCHRVEVYCFAETFHGAYQNVRDFLSDTANCLPEYFSDSLYSYYDTDAATHLFSVACGLDSAVLGEHEIQGQVKSAWNTALVEGTCGTALNALFRQAIEVGKRARSETGISQHITSISQAAVALASERLKGLTGHRLMVVGAGDMGEGMVASLAKSGVAEVVVANRTPGRAAELAERIGGRAVGLNEMSTELAVVDVLLTSTGASSLILEYCDVAEIMAQRSNYPLLIVDVAVPRDVDPMAGDLPGVTLLDMDDLRTFANRGLRERQAELERVRHIIDHELSRYLDHSSAREAAPLITALRTRAEILRREELDRHATRLSAVEQKALDAATRSLVAKLLHEPTVRLKDASGSPRGDRLAEALRDLFDL